MYVYQGGGDSGGGAGRLQGGGGGLGTLNYGILENCESNLVKFCEYMVLTCSFLSPLELEGMV